MKHINFYLSVLLAFTLVSCASKEEKANKLIKQYMYESLYDFESYEPMKTTVDSLYADVRFDDEALSYAKAGRKSLNEVSGLLDEMHSAQQSMDIWSDSYTSFGRSKFEAARNEFKEKYEAVQQSLREVYMSMLKILDRKEYIEQNQNGEFVGWKVEHKFRCKTKGGNAAIGNYIFIFDKDLKEIINTYDIDDDDYSSIVDFLEEALDREKEELQKSLKDTQEPLE